MDIAGEHTVIFQKKRWLWQTGYWLFAALLLFFVFSNRQYDLIIRITVVVILIIMSIGLTLMINHYFIPNFLFKGRYFLFGYLVIGSFIVSVWINLLCILIILWYSVNKFQEVMLPDGTDLLLLVSGSYIIILFAAFVHFIKETFLRKMEHDKVESQKIEMELKLKEARLKLLQDQLNPHFLFNMLNNIYGLWMENSKTTPEVILKLSALLDYMLHDCSKKRVPVYNEIQFIRNYIELERIRHDKRLNININMPDINNSHMIAPLVLFVFVENAFKHGANSNPGESIISVELKSGSNFIDFNVTNNYIKSDRHRSGLGLKNVAERLNLIYPGNHKLDFQITEDEFSVYLNIQTD
jgi:two-component system, LytTR family, sensor kinase